MPLAETFDVRQSFTVSFFRTVFDDLVYVKYKMLLDDGQMLTRSNLDQHMDDPQHLHPRFSSLRMAA